MERAMKKESVVSRLSVGLVVLFFCTVLAGPALASELLLDLGVLPGGTYSMAYDLSKDGSVVVGTATDASGNDKAFRWTHATGIVDLGTLPGSINTIARAVSANDGSVTVGGQSIVPIGNHGHAFRWTQATGMVDLGTLPSGKYSIA